MAEIPVFKKDGRKVVLVGVVSRPTRASRKGNGHDGDHARVFPSQSNFGNWEASQKAYMVLGGRWSWLHDDTKKGASHSFNPSRSWKDQANQKKRREVRKKIRRNVELRRQNPLLNSLPEQEKENHLAVFLQEDWR